MANTRTCFITEIKPGKIDEYRRYHDNIFPEVVAGLRSAGVAQLTIFQLPGTSTLVMYIVTAGPIDLGAATGPGSRYRMNPRCREWEELMDADFHGGWATMDEIHSSDVQWNRAMNAPMQTDDAGPRTFEPQLFENEPRPLSNTGPINRSHVTGGNMMNTQARYEGQQNFRPKSPGTGRRGMHPPGGFGQIKFG